MKVFKDDEIQQDEYLKIIDEFNDEDLKRAANGDYCFSLKSAEF